MRDRLTLNETAKILKLTKQRVSQLTRGFCQKKGNKEYFIKPKLHENIDYVWERGRIYFYKDRIEKLTEN